MVCDIKHINVIEDDEFLFVSVASCRQTTAKFFRVPGRLSQDGWHGRDRLANKWLTVLS